MGTTIRPYVRQYFERNPGRTIWRDELIEYVALQNQEKIREATVLHSVNALIQDGFPIEIQERAHAWIYLPNKKKDEPKVDPGRKMFELLANTKSGAMILEDTEGEVVIVKVVDL